MVVQGLRKEFVTETNKGCCNSDCCNKKDDTGIKVAVKNNNFMVMPGEVLGLLGPNGAGKTTTLNMVIAEEGPTAGKVSRFTKQIKKSNISSFAYVLFWLSESNNIDICFHYDLFAPKIQTAFVFAKTHLSLALKTIVFFLHPGASFTTVDQL